MRFTDFLLITVLGALLGMSLALGVGAVVDSGLPPCSSDGPAVTEDCAWIAAEQGDGNGVDFVQIDGVVYYR